MPVRHAAEVVVAGAEKIGRVGCVVGTLHLGFEEDAHLSVHGLFGVGSVSVPDDTGRADLGDLVQRLSERLPADVGVVYHAEVGLFLRARGAE